MVIQVNRTPSVYTVKFTEGVGTVALEDFSATGTWDAQMQWRKKYPDAELVGIFRKS
jgi:hypothetical protein